MSAVHIGVLASGGGSNLQSIIDSTLDGSIDAKIVVVISNNSNAGALHRASRHNIEILHISAQTAGTSDAVDKAITREMLNHDVELVVLAGYMKKIGPELLNAYEGRILNIHPALLPKYGGKGMYGIHVHEAVLAAGETESGVTVHIVDGKYDNGNILAQVKVPVYPDDSPESLQKRVLKEEHKIYPETIRVIIEKWHNNK